MAKRIPRTTRQISDTGAVNRIWRILARPEWNVEDLESIADGYISVTPLHLDLTHEPSMTGLEALFA